jgi:hypothetical protein
LISDAAFIVLPVALVLMFAWGTSVAWQRAGASPARARRAALQTLVLAAAWMAVTWTVAARGVLGRWDRLPPPFMVMIAGVVAIAVAIAYSRLGARLAFGLPLWSLVAFQAFRLPLEIAMHRTYERGIMPGQMSYSGSNFDIVTGLTAVLVAALVWSGRAGTRLVIAWNVLGLVLLANIVTIAFLSTPPFQYFGPDRVNVFVTRPPYVWLPAVLVLAALAGHLVIFRAAARSRDQRTHSEIRSAR